MNSYEKVVWVGVLVLLATAGFLGGALWLTGKSVGHADAIILYADIGDLKDGSPVRISGAPVGRVSGITYLGVGRVAVAVTFSRGVHVPVTRAATASIVSVGMLGDAAIAFDPGKGPPLQRGDTLQGTLAKGIFDKAAGLTDQASVTMTRLNSMLDPRVIADLRATLEASRKLMDNLADQKNGPTSQVNATMLALQATSARLDTVLSGVDPKTLQSRLDSTMKSAGSAADRLATMTSHMDSLMAQIQHSNGTYAKFMNDSMLYVDLRKTLEATADLINELKKNPGKIGITVRVP